jgi:hypothetical protein
LVLIFPALGKILRSLEELGPLVGDILLFLFLDFSLTVLELFKPISAEVPGPIDDMLFLFVVLRILEILMSICENNAKYTELNTRILPLFCVFWLPR